MELDSCVPVKLIKSDSGALTNVSRKRKRTKDCSAIMSQVHYVPEELIIEILLLLPVNSLLRFISLSKDIGTFINLNLCQFLKLIYSDDDGSENNKLHVCDVNLNMKKRKILQLGKSYTSQVKFKFYSYCKGLILLKRSDELFGLTLWNPFTNNYKDLPHCPVKKDGFELFSTTHVLGLVYDDYINDYKAFISVSYSRNLRFHYEDQVWVYELKSNIWRKIENNNRFRFKSYDTGCFTNGSLHWLSENDQKTRQIDAFDVRKETFYLVPLPNCKINKINNGVKAELHDLEGCLCISYFRNNMHFQADLYMRKKDEEVDDDDDPFTWIQLYSTTILPGDLINMFVSSGTIKIWGYPKTDDDKEKILFHLGNKDYIVFYNLERKTFGKVKIVNKDPTWVAPFFLC